MATRSAMGIRQYGLLGLGGVALLLLTAATLSVREENTMAVFLQKSKGAKAVSGLDVPPAPKLSYGGPMYSGDGIWTKDDKVVMDTNAREPARSSQEKQEAAKHAAHKHSKARAAHASRKGAAKGPAGWMDTVAAEVKSFKKHASDISNGFGQAFDIHDNAVHHKKPVKVLTHV